MESQDSMTAPALELEKGDEEPIGGDGQRYELCSEATSGWTRRVRLGKAPEEREMNPDRKQLLSRLSVLMLKIVKGMSSIQRLAQNLTHWTRLMNSTTFIHGRLVLVYGWQRAG